MQMTTTHSTVGTSDQFVPREKKFFLPHWLEALGGNQRTARRFFLTAFRVRFRTDGR
jgi:hypothetical protein